jgi:hypothetical protein
MPCHSQAVRELQTSSATRSEVYLTGEWSHYLALITGCTRKEFAARQSLDEKWAIEDRGSGVKGVPVLCSTTVRHVANYSLNLTPQVTIGPFDIGNIYVRHSACYAHNRVCLIGTYYTVHKD